MCQSHYPPSPKKPELENIRHMQLLVMLNTITVKQNSKETHLLGTEKNNSTSNFYLTITCLIKYMQQVAL